MSECIKIRPSLIERVNPVHQSPGINPRFTPELSKINSSNDIIDISEKAKNIFEILKVIKSILGTYVDSVGISENIILLPKEIGVKRARAVSEAFNKTPVSHDNKCNEVPTSSPEFDHWCIFLTDQVSPPSSSKSWYHPSFYSRIE